MCKRISGDTWEKVTKLCRESDIDLTSPFTPKDETLPDTTWVTYGFRRGFPVMVSYRPMSGVIDIFDWVESINAA